MIDIGGMEWLCKSGDTNENENDGDYDDKAYCQIR